MLNNIPFKYPQIGQFVLCKVDDNIKNWSLLPREQIPMETVGIISLVKKEFVYYTDYTGKFTSFQWRFLPQDAEEWIPNKIHRWEDTTPLKLLEYNLAKKYRQTIEAFKRDASGIVHTG